MVMPMQFKKLTIFLSLCLLLLAPPAKAGTIPLKVVILTTYTVEDISRVPIKYSLEIKRWYDKNFADAEYYRVKETDSYIYIKEGLAFVTIAKGKKDAAGSLSALLKDERFDFSEAYFIVCGYASVPPQTASTGSVCIAEWALDHEYKTAVVRKGKKKFTAVKSGSLFRLNGDLVRWSLRLNRGTKLADNARAAKYRDLYPLKTARSSPLIYQATSVTASPKRSGGEVSAYAERLCREHRAGRYGILQEEDNAIAYVLKRSRHLDRLLIIRAATDFDQKPQGRPAGESGRAFAIGVINNYRVASPVVKEIIGNWDAWRRGVPKI